MPKKKKKTFRATCKITYILRNNKRNFFQPKNGRIFFKFYRGAKSKNSRFFTTQGRLKIFG